jgi:hypothetical protein
MRGGTVWGLLGLLGVTFLAGVIYLVDLGLESGSMYPRFSTLRSDPPGSRAYAETLAELGLPMRRNYLDYSRLELPPGATVFLLGASSRTRGPEKEIDALLAEVERGARLVVAFDGRLSPALFEAWPGSSAGPVSVPGKDDPEVPSPEEESAEVEPSQNDAEAAAEDEDVGETETKGVPSRADRMEALFATASLLERLGLGLDEAGDGRANRTAARGAAAPPGLPAELPHLSDLRLVERGDAWEALYTQRGRPVALRRDLGAGEVIALADAYLLSNEALRFRPEPAWLRWLAGDATLVVFDETLHGAYESPGIGGLIRRYRLGGIFLGGLVLAGLFVWRNATSLLPPAPEARRSVVEGRSNEAGFVNLLRRAVPPSRLPRTAFEAWLDSPAFRRLPSTRRASLREAAERIVAAAESGKARTDPLPALRELSQLIQTKEP